MQSEAVAHSAKSIADERANVMRRCFVENIDFILRTPVCLAHCSFPLELSIVLRRDPSAWKFALKCSFQGTAAVTSTAM